MHSNSIVWMYNSVLGVSPSFLCHSSITKHERSSVVFIIQQNKRVDVITQEFPICVTRIEEVCVTVLPAVSDSFMINWVIC